MAASSGDKRDAQDHAKPTGFPSDGRYHDSDTPAERRVPFTGPLITEELIDETRRVWSKAAGRPITYEEALEILFNVRNFAYALINAKLGGDKE